MDLEIGIPEECRVELRIFDVTGRCIRNAIDVLWERAYIKSILMDFRQAFISTTSGQERNFIEGRF